MPKLTRANQLVFGSTGGTTEFGKIGSDAAGTPETTKDLEAIQSLSQYLSGLYGITASAAEPPRIEDINALYYLMTSQLRYLFQNGVPEWHEDAEYYATVSYCQRGGAIYRSVTDDNVGNDPATDDGTNWEAGDASLRQLKFDLDELGFTGYALYTDKYLEHKRDIARSMPVGMTIFSSMKLTPTAFSAAKSTANPSNPEYAPYVDRSLQQDLDIATWPKLATLRDVKAMVLGEVDFTVTVTGSSVVLPNTAAGVAMTKNIIADAAVSGWLNTNQAVDAAADYTTATTQRCINIAGTDYAITGATLATRTLTVSGTPAAGSQTASFYTYRVAGSTDVRLHKMTGFVPVAEGDADAEVMGGWRRMWRMQGHRHGWASVAPAVNAAGSGGLQGTQAVATASIGDPTTDGTNGTPLTGKTTDPRTMGQYVYTFAGVYL